MDISTLPFNALIGIERCPEPDRVFSLPGDARYTNHLGTVHASALMALAEATSGEFLLRAFPDFAGTTVPVVRRFEVKFRKPANGAIFSTASIPPEKKNEFAETFERRSKASIDVLVEISEEHGTHALSATIGWFVAKIAS